jgi:hypothetical protein
LSVLALAGEDFLRQMKIAGPKIYIYVILILLQFYQSSAVSRQRAKRARNPLIAPFPDLSRLPFFSRLLCFSRLSYRAVAPS